MPETPGLDSIPRVNGSAPGANSTVLRDWKLKLIPIALASTSEDQSLFRVSSDLPREDRNLPKLHQMPMQNALPLMESLYCNTRLTLTLTLLLRDG